MKTRIDIEYIKEIQKNIDDINSLKLEDIDFYKNGKKLVVDKEILNDWRFTGLNNMQFVTGEFYKDSCNSQ